MDSLRIETMSMDPNAAANKERQKAEKVAGQFEAIFVQTFVSSLRQTASLGGESMFGQGPGSDTYAGWFDQNIADELSRGGGIGIEKALLQDMERHRDIAKDPKQQPTELLDKARSAADRHAFDAIKTKAGGSGGSDGSR